MDKTAMIVAGAMPFFIIGVVLFRYWLLGDTGMDPDQQRELNAENNIHITRLDLDKK